MFRKEGRNIEAASFPSSKPPRGRSTKDERIALISARRQKAFNRKCFHLITRCHLIVKRLRIQYGKRKERVEGDKHFVCGRLFAEIEFLLMERLAAVCEGKLSASGGFKVFKIFLSSEITKSSRQEKYRITHANIEKKKSQCLLIMSSVNQFKTTPRAAARMICDETQKEFSMKNSFKCSPHQVLEKDFFQLFEGTRRFFCWVNVEVDTVEDRKKRATGKIFNFVKSSPSLFMFNHPPSYYIHPPLQGAA